MSFNIHQKVIFAVRSGNLELIKKRIAEGGDKSSQSKDIKTALKLATDI